MDRGTEATLTRTIPRSGFKSYTKDWTLPRLELVIYCDGMFALETPHSTARL